jgi:hypothetical protein
VRVCVCARARECVRASVRRYGSAAPRGDPQAAATAVTVTQRGMTRELSDDSLQRGVTREISDDSQMTREISDDSRMTREISDDSRMTREIGEHTLNAFADSAQEALEDGLKRLVSAPSLSL